MRGFRSMRWASAVLLVGSCGGRQGASHAGFVDAPVAAVAAPVAGQLAVVLVREGQHVKRGELLARLDTRERAALVTQAEADVQHARDAVHEATHNAEAMMPTVRGAEADVLKQQAELADAEAEFARISQLVRTGATPASQLDAARARLDAARATVAGMGANRQATRGRVSAALASVRAARSALTVSEAALGLARVQLEQAEIRSPFDGVVSEQNLQPGEWAAAGTPVVTVEDLAHPWVRADIEETALAALRLGQRARIRVIAFPGRAYTGHVTQIGAEAEFAVNRDVKRGRPDVRTFRVRVSLDQVASELRPGMTAEIVLEQKEPAP